MTEETETQDPQQSLAEILQGRDERGRFTAKPPADDAPEPEPQGEPEPAAPQPSPEGEPQPQAEAQPGPSPVPEKDPREDEIKGLKAELARIRRQRSQDGQPRPQPPKAPSVLDDEEGFVKHLTSNFEDAVFYNRLMLSQDMALDRFKDFREVMGTEGDGPEMMHVNWLNAVDRDPSLRDQFRRASNPAAFAYQTLKRQKFLSEVGDDPSAYKDKLRAEIRAELEAEMKASQNGNGAARTPTTSVPVVPRSLAGTASKATREASEDQGPKPLGDILATAPFARPR